MAFLRLPTKESGGRANLFQGAIACGIDLATGMTTHAICHTEYVSRFPGTKKLLSGIVIPEWEGVMELAIKASDAAGLGYMRADVVLQPSIKHPGKTIPKILELNAQPGLKIQLCNKDGLRRRLERVEGLEVETPQKGIRIAQELFADRRIRQALGENSKTIGVFEEVELNDSKGVKHLVKAKIDTGADGSSIDAELAETFGLLSAEAVLFTKRYRNAIGSEERQVIPVTFTLGGKQIQTAASVANRSAIKSSRPLLIGRRDLTGFSIKIG